MSPEAFSGEVNTTSLGEMFALIKLDKLSDLVESDNVKFLPTVHGDVRVALKCRNPIRSIATQYEKIISAAAFPAYSDRKIATQSRPPRHTFWACFCGIRASNHKPVARKIKRAPE
jgi:hypothetical protein